MDEEDRVIWGLALGIFGCDEVLRLLAKFLPDWEYPRLENVSGWQRWRYADTPGEITDICIKLAATDSAVCVFDENCIIISVIHRVILRNCLLSILPPESLPENLLEQRLSLDVGL